MKALIKTAEKNGYKMGLFLQAVTEWKQFRMPSFGVMKRSMKNALIIDGRNIYDPKNSLKLDSSTALSGASGKRCFLLQNRSLTAPIFV
ncbi:hypothetical protein SAMN05720473_101945 [Fibrobacter sp. UWB15]|nr:MULTISPECIES: UDP-glucose/GDP-mannose dehydrogenase family protein [unclassified Fibrobacter]PWJ68061.1 hypothetical protein BGW99_101946 [Fibrobacter sp. UWB6]SHF85829.1 hypothetical protein SAMN05720760_101911 [Fibrobacter sp. UWB8]SMG17902.1 hypothetical protein SAMN05720473_101945 [Fibrobacter sp. UWB15]